MSERYLDVFRLFTSGLSHKEISSRLDISASLSTQELARARAGLTEEIIGMSVPELEKKYGTSIEIIAEEARNSAEKLRDKLFSEGDSYHASRLSEVIDYVAGISPPSETRFNRRKNEFDASNNRDA
ncbi:hypothetical protein O4H61_16690 [Roseovarius aestuarii]|nr:hypothetical protein [Roseovarius aestuarii]